MKSLFVFATLASSLVATSVFAETNKQMCDDLWVARNNIYAQMDDWCFTSPQAIAYFGNPDTCKTNRRPLTVSTLMYLQNVQDAEKKYACAKGSARALVRTSRGVIRADFSANKRLIRLCLGLEAHDIAVDACTAALTPFIQEKKEAYYSLRYSRARHKYALGEYFEAYADASDVRIGAGNTYTARAHNLTGLVFEAFGQTKAALQMFEVAHQIEHDNESFHFNYTRMKALLTSENDE